MRYGLIILLFPALIALGSGDLVPSSEVNPRHCPSKLKLLFSRWEELYGPTKTIPVDDGHGGFVEVSKPDPKAFAGASAESIARFGQELKAVGLRQAKPEDVWWRARPYGITPTSLYPKPVPLSPQQSMRYGTDYVRHATELSRIAKTPLERFVVNTLAFLLADLDTAKSTLKKAQDLQNPELKQEAMARYDDLLTKLAEVTMTHAHTQLSERQLVDKFRTMTGNALEGWLKSHDYPYRREKIPFIGKNQDAIILLDTEGTPWKPLYDTLRKIDPKNKKQLALFPSQIAADDMGFAWLGNSNYFQVSPSTLLFFPKFEVNVMIQTRMMEIEQANKKGAISPFSGSLHQVDGDVNTATFKSRGLEVNYSTLSGVFASLADLRSQFLKSKDPLEKRMLADMATAVSQETDKLIQDYITLIETEKEGLTQLIGGFRDQPKSVYRAEEGGFTILPSGPDGKPLEPTPWRMIASPIKNETAGTVHWKLAFHWKNTIRVFPGEILPIKKSLQEMSRLISLVGIIGDSVMSDKKAAILHLFAEVFKTGRKFSEEAFQIYNQNKKLSDALFDYRAEPTAEHEAKLGKIWKDLKDPGVLGQVLTLDVPVVKPTIPRLSDTDQKYLPPTLKSKWQSLSSLPGGDSLRKKALENVSLAVASSYFKSLGWRIKNISNLKAGFDLVLTHPKTGEILRVEVKGRSDHADYISLTPNEVHYAKANDRTYLALVLVDKEGNVGLHIRKADQDIVGQDMGRLETSRSIDIDGFIETPPIPGGFPKAN